MIRQFLCSVLYKSIGDKENSVFLTYVSYVFTLNAITSVMLIISIY